MFVKRSVRLGVSPEAAKQRTRRLPLTWCVMAKLKAPPNPPSSDCFPEVYRPDGIPPAGLRATVPAPQASEDSPPRSLVLIGQNSRRSRRRSARRTAGQRTSIVSSQRNTSVVRDSATAIQPALTSYLDLLMTEHAPHSTRSSPSCANLCSSNSIFAGASHRVLRETPRHAVGDSLLLTVSV